MGRLVSKSNVFETENLHVTCYNPDRTRLIVSFDHWKPVRSGFPAPKPSEFFAKNDVAFMTIHSSRNDWFLSPDLPALQLALDRFTEPYDRVTSIGYSMGGYGALLLSRATRSNQVVLVSPQYSIFAQHAPFETRYEAEAALLDPKLDTLATKPRQGLRGVILFDPTVKIDVKHVALITKLFPKITSVPLPFGGHPALNAISGAKQYQKIQEELLRNNVRPGAFLRTHKQARRIAPCYQDGLAQYLARRRARSP